MSTRGSLARAFASVLGLALPLTGAASAGAVTTGAGHWSQAAPASGQAAALARAGVVQQQDVPRAQSTTASAHSLADFRADEAGFYRCLGYTQPTYLARGFGPKLSAANGQEEILSTADVAATDQAAKDTMTVHHSQKGADCYRRRLLGALHRINRTGEVVVSQVAFGVPGADETYAYRSTITVHGPHGDSTVEALLVGSRVGSVLTSISVSIGQGRHVDGSDIQGAAAKPLARIHKILTH